MKIDCCYECKKRILGCHANCGDYAEQKAEYEQEKEEKRNAQSGSYCPSLHKPLRGLKMYQASRGY